MMSRTRYFVWAVFVVLPVVIVGCGAESDPGVAGNEGPAPATSPQAPKLPPPPPPPPVSGPGTANDASSAGDNSQQPGVPVPSVPTPPPPPKPPQTESKQLATLGHVPSVFVSADGTKLVTCALRGEKPFGLWDLSTGKKLSAFGEADSRASALSPDGRFLVVSSREEQEEGAFLGTVLHIASGKTREVRIAASYVGCAGFTHDSTSVVYVGSHGESGRTIIVSRKGCSSRGQ